MPSSVLHDQILHSILFPNQPLFYLPPRVFGCICFVHILTPGQDKFSTKATKCVFLNYSHLQRGYHCYSPDIHRYLVSTDVTFFAKLFYVPYHPSFPVLMFYLYPFFFPFQILYLYLRLQLNHCRFIPDAQVLTPGLQLTHLLWRLPPRRRSSCLPLIFPFPFAKILVPLVTLILFIVS